MTVLWTFLPGVATATLRFTDVTAAAGITFVHESGRAGAKLLPETMGAGVALFDYDGDGWLDLLFVNGRAWKDDGRSTTPALYRNRGDGTFADVTRGSGLDVELYGMGAAVADFDADGDADVYLTALEGDRLFRNGGDGTFTDVTAAAGIANRDFGTSAAWLDVDRDGDLDLFVANYVRWSVETDQRCSLDGRTRSYCTPEVYPGVASRLFRNRGDGSFEDVSAAAGIADPSAKALGVAVLDFDGDRWPDLFVANDTRPNQLFRNRGDGSFVDVALEAGVAFSEEGQARGAMGAAAGDWDRSGRAHLLVGNFSSEMAALYRNEGEGLFRDVARASPLGPATLPTLAFGALLFDHDLDGWLDALLANGHIEETIQRVQPAIPYAQPTQLFRNQGGRFMLANDTVGPDLGTPRVARGAAYGDVDGDGDLDLALTTNHGPAVLLRNDGGDANRWLRVRARGTGGNRDGLGTVVRLHRAGGAQWAVVHSGSSYCSASEPQVTLGLGDDQRVETVEVEWPGGRRRRYLDVPAGVELVVDERH
jgi:hypothetical protein